MKILRLKIKNYRSIKDISVVFPEDKPVVLFGSNNSGKSNILKGLDCVLGERHPSFLEYQDSDYFSRNKELFPNIYFEVEFDEAFYSGNTHVPATETICFSTNMQQGRKKEHTYHNLKGQKIFLSNEDKQKCQFVLIDASRDINRQLSYFSQYSMLSKMSKRMHAVLVAAKREELSTQYQQIKSIFESVPEYGTFLQNLRELFSGNIDGFEHKLEIDLSAYDPNNYFNSLRIIAKENDHPRAFDEFGTGEQQVLLMSFMSAYAKTFSNETFVLGIEEPESHLHPLAQKWLSYNIKNICRSGIQVIITTHSPEFLSIQNLEGLTKVYKETHVTKTHQHSRKTLVEDCLRLKSDPAKTKVESIVEFYVTNTFYDQLKGFFARKILLVEGQTEQFSLPNYFGYSDYDLIKNGVEIIVCHGKNQISRNYRLFTSYLIQCFCLFDGDVSKNGNEDLGNTLGFDFTTMNQDPCLFIYGENYCYFGIDFETYMKRAFQDYQTIEDEIVGSKVLKAKYVSENKKKYKPEFIEKVSEKLRIQKNAS